MYWSEENPQTFRYDVREHFFNCLLFSGTIFDVRALVPSGGRDDDGDAREHDAHRTDAQAAARSHLQVERPQRQSIRPRKQVPTL